MDVNDIHTEKDLRYWIKLKDQELDKIAAQVDDLKAAGGARRMELAESRIARLHAAGVDYDQAFEQVLAELEASERQTQAKVEQAQRERIELELQELTPEQERLILEQGEEG